MRHAKVLEFLEGHLSSGEVGLEVEGQACQRQERQALLNWKQLVEVLECYVEANWEVLWWRWRLGGKETFGLAGAAVVGLGSV
jgi:hypothetical protein